MAIDVGVVILFASCLQSIIFAVPVHHSKDTPRNVTSNSIEDEFHIFNPFAESSVASRLEEKMERISELKFPEDMTEQEPVSMSLKPSQKKRDKEEEADSANGKSPIPILYKKSFSFGDELGNSKVFANQKDYAGFPPYTGAVGGVSGVPYQRQRRSYHLPMESSLQSSLHKKLPSDKMEIRLDNERDREAFLRLMALLAARETSPSNYNLLNADEVSLFKPDEDEGNFEDDGDAPLDLGYYGEEPFVPASASAYDKPISLMSSGAPADLTRMGLHLSQVPGSHGLYLTSPPNAPVGMNLLGNQHYPGSTSQRILDDGDEWLDDAMPLQSHLKTRRSDPNALFRFNPVKSHFRRYLRTPASDYFNYDNGQFGLFYPPGSNGGLIRKRRDSPGAFGNM